MDNSTVIISLLFIIAIALFSLIGIFAYIALKRPSDSTTEETQLLSKKLDQLAENKSKERILGLCSICEKELVENDYFDVDSLHLCREHLDVYSRNSWKPITNQRTTADTPEAGVYIYNFKKDIWAKQKVPSYILCEYKIDIESDKIETYVQLYVQEELEETLKSKIRG